MSGKDADLKMQLEEATLALRSCEARLRNIIARSTDGIIILDDSGHIKFVNPAAEFLFNRQTGDLLGNRFGFPVMAGETTELDIVSLEKKRTVVEMRVVETEWEGSKAYLATLRDITERKLAVEEIERLNTNLRARVSELEDANRELDAFNYTVSHDLRKPLTIINGYCQEIIDECGNKLDEQCKGYFTEIYNGTLRMNELINVLLDFSDLSHRELHRKTVDLSELAKIVAAQLGLTGPERRVTFRIAEDVIVYGDVDLLRIVLENLLGNAWKYTGTRERGVIEFGVTEIDGNPACFVRDNGSGFDMTDAKRLFIPFQCLSHTDEMRGHGIGLATVERIIKRHGGKVWAVGERGKGATFYFTLPADETVSSS